MANTAEDNRISDMFSQLEKMKKAGQDSSEPGSEYMQRLYELRDATRARAEGFVIAYDSSRSHTAKRRTMDRQQERRFKQASA